MIIDTELLDYAVEVLFHIIDCFRYGKNTSQYLCADPERFVRGGPTQLRWLGSGLIKNVFFAAQSLMPILLMK